MNSSSFHSVLATPFATFVRYKQALNRKYRTEAAALRLLDRLWDRHRSLRLDKKSRTRLPATQNDASWNDLSSHR